MLVPAASRELATLKDTPTWRALLLKGDLPAFLLRCEQAGRLSHLSASDKAIVEKARQDSKTSTTLRSNPFADLANWIPDEHPRWPKGSGKKSGEFIGKGDPGVKFRGVTPKLSEYGVQDSPLPDNKNQKFIFGPDGSQLFFPPVDVSELDHRDVLTAAWPGWKKAPEGSFAWGYYTAQPPENWGWDKATGTAFKKPAEGVFPRTEIQAASGEPSPEAFDHLRNTYPKSKAVWWGYDDVYTPEGKKVHTVKDKWSEVTPAMLDTTLHPNPFADLANWVPDEHPRWPKGTPNAGEFMPKGSAFNKSGKVLKLTSEKLHDIPKDITPETAKALRAEYPSLEKVRVPVMPGAMVYDDYNVKKLAKGDTGSKAVNKAKPSSNSSSSISPRPPLSNPRTATPEIASKSADSEASSPGYSSASQSVEDIKKARPLGKLDDQGLLDWQDSTADDTGKLAGTPGNHTLEQIAKAQGIDGTPTLRSLDEMDKLERDKGWTGLYRGVATPQFMDQFKHGDYYGGAGMYGDGTYTAYGPTSKEDATGYAGRSKDDKPYLIRAAMPPDAKVITHDEAIDRQRQDLQDLADRHGRASTTNLRLRALLNDPGQWAALNGYDAISVPEMGYMVVLNRGMLAAEDK